MGPSRVRLDISGPFANTRKGSTMPLSQFLDLARVFIGAGHVWPALILALAVLAVYVLYDRRGGRPKDRGPQDPPN